MSCKISSPSDGESNLLTLEAVVKKKILILDVLQMLICKHFITSELRQHKAMTDALKVADYQNLMNTTVKQ